MTGWDAVFGRPLLPPPMMRFASPRFASPTHDSSHEINASGSLAAIEALASEVARLQGQVDAAEAEAEVLRADKAFLAEEAAVLRVAAEQAQV